MICPTCGNEHDGSYGSGKYCNRSCSNTRKVTEETKNKIRKTLKDNFNTTGILYRNYKNISEEQKEKTKKTWNTKILESDFDKLSIGLKRKRIILEQENRCGKCGISEWFGSPIILELDHIDGNKQNETRENLICLCPNCHSQTSTWRGRNQYKNIRFYTDEELYSIYLECGKNINKTLDRLGYSSFGAGNYKRLKKIIMKVE